MTETIDLINALSDNKTSSANNVFNDLMASKLTAALDAKKIEIANDTYNNVTQELEQEIASDEVQGNETVADFE